MGGRGGEEKKFPATRKNRAHVLVCGLTPFPGWLSRSSTVLPFTPHPSSSFQGYAQLNVARLTATPTPQMGLVCPCFVTSFSQYFIISTFSKNPRTGSFAGNSGWGWEMGARGGVETCEGEVPDIPRRGCLGGKAWEKPGRRAGERNPASPLTQLGRGLCSEPHPKLSGWTDRPSGWTLGRNTSHYLTISAPAC